REEAKKCRKIVVYSGVAINNVHHQGPRKNGPGLRRTDEPAFCQQRIILSGLGFRGSYAIHFSSNFRGHLLHRGVHTWLSVLLVQPA
ncbi:TPA: hypothetical protein ACXEWJ_002069, partial [Klebsiella variicola]